MLKFLISILNTPFTTRKFYFLLLILGVLLWQSCSTPGNPILDQAIQKIDYSSQVLDYETHLVHLEMQELTKTKTHYQAIFQHGLPLRAIQKRTISYLDSLSRLKKYTPEDGQQLVLLLNQSRQMFLQTILDIWKGGGVKGTIFANSTQQLKTNEHLKQILYPIRQLTSDTAIAIQNLFARTDWTKVQQYLKISKNTVNLAIYDLLSYLNGQFSRMHWYPRPIIAQWYKPHYIYQSQMVPTSIVLQKAILNQDFLMQVNTVPIDANNTRLNYQRKSNHIGMQQDTITIDFVIPRLQDTIRHQVTKIIHYEVIP